jgi:hypothetical protein
VRQCLWYLCRDWRASTALYGRTQEIKWDFISIHNASKALPFRCKKYTGARYLGKNIQIQKRKEFEALNALTCSKARTTTSRRVNKTKMNRPGSPKVAVYFSRGSWHQPTFPPFLLNQCKDDQADNDDHCYQQPNL